MYYSFWQPTYSVELYHHGIKGQKWGVRRFQNKDGTRTKAGKERAKKQLTPEQEYNKKWNHADSLGAQLATTTALATAGLAAGAATGNAYVLYFGASMAAQVPGQTIALGKGLAADFRTRKLETDASTGLKIKDPSKTWTPEEDMKAVNPEYDTLSKIDLGARHNCMLCSMTYDLRRRGYDVRANRALSGWQDEDVAHWYPGYKHKEIGKIYDKTPNTPEELKQCLASPQKSREERKAYVDSAVAELNKQKVGSRGLLTVQWRDSLGGHAMAYEVHKDGPHVYDCQTGKEKKGDDLLNTLYNTDSINIGRLDNLKPDPKTIKEVTKH